MNAEPPTDMLSSGQTLANQVRTTIEPYERYVGRSVLDLPTPALVIDLEAAERNLRRMADFLRGGSVGLRPHIKVHKSIDAARLQMGLGGAHGVCTATLAEAAVMIRGGIDDVLIANQIVGSDKATATARLAGDATLMVAVDDVANLRELSAAATAAGTSINVLIEYDVGMGRGGIRDPTALPALAEAAVSAPGIRFRGLMGYEGHCMSIEDRDARARETRAAMDRLADAVALLESAGYPCEIVSGGGTGTYFVSAAGPPLTETQAGSYMVMDAFHGRLVPEFETALTVIGSVVSHRTDVAVVDVGEKGVNAEDEPPQLLDCTASISFIHEEHMGLVDEVPGRLPGLGQRVTILPGYGPMTANLYAVYYVAREGVVIDIWPILARHPGWAWV
jgi:D-serine deaminase-like pyridoxal phosphate-dependent protein